MYEDYFNAQLYYYAVVVPLCLQNVGRKENILHTFIQNWREDSM